jgi:hypothetical protein
MKASKKSRLDRHADKLVKQHELNEKLREKEIKLDLLKLFKK